MGRRLCFLLMVLVIVSLCSAQKDRKPSTGGSGDSGSGGTGSGDSGSGGTGSGDSGSGGTGSGDSGSGGTGTGDSGSGGTGTGGSGSGGQRPPIVRPSEAPRPPMPPQPRQQAICGDDTPFILKTRMKMSYIKAKKYILEHRNEMWGWGNKHKSGPSDPFSQFENTASAIMALQLASEGEWYGKSVEDLKSHLSVKQLEVENLAFMSHFLAALHMKRNNESCEGNTTSHHMMNGTRHGHNMTRGDGNMTRPNITDMIPGMRNNSMMMNGSMQQNLMMVSNLINNIIALNLTCHSPVDFYGNHLLKVLNYALDMLNEKEMMMDRNHTSPVANATRPERPSHTPNSTQDHMCDRGSARKYRYGMGLLMACRVRGSVDETIIRCMLAAHARDGLYKESGSGVYLMAMSCIKPTVPEELQQNFTSVMRAIASHIKNETENGSIGNPVRIAYALQALKYAGPESRLESRQCTSAVRKLLNSQNDEGAFGDSLGATIAVLPALAHKSMADLKYVEPDCERMSHGGDGRPGGMGPGGDGGMGGGRPRFPGKFRRGGE